MDKPLSGMRVLDLSRLLPGPSATLLLSDLGADVVKIEDPDPGDYLREISPGMFGALNRGKRSAVLDLKSAEGKALLEKLAELTGVEVDAEGLRRAADVTRERIDELIANSDEHATMVRQLEAQHDAEVGLSGFGPGPLPSGEELGAELERFLRGERGERGERGDG